MLKDIHFIVFIPPKASLFNNMVAQNDGNCKIKPQLFAKREVRYYAQNIALNFVFLRIDKEMIFMVLLYQRRKLLTNKTQNPIMKWRKQP